MDPGTWAGLRNAAVFDLQPGLPGVFEANPYPAIVNGSMWTLPIECAFYLALPALALLGMLRPRIVLLAAATSLVLLFPVAAWFGLSWAAQGPFLLWSAPLYPVLSSLSWFLMGAAFWVHRGATPLSGGLAICCLIALFASDNTISAGFVFHIAFPYLVLYMALARPCTERFLRPVGDLSYGAYLYAFPVQQSVIALHSGAIGPHRLAVLAAPVVLVCAALSCHLIEQPALRLKGRPRLPRISRPELVG
jgi:peptidoglycan/LPS O-acetylase OafA/YrhL